MRKQQNKGWKMVGYVLIILFAHIHTSIAQTIPKIIDFKTISQNDSDIQDKKVDSKTEEKRYISFDGYDRMPTFTGGEKELLNFIAKSIRYPIADKEKVIEGRVIVRFIVTKTGKIEKAKVVRSVSELIDEEALRVVNSLPNFIPGESEGNKVDINFTLPITFRITPITNKTKVYKVVEKMPEFPGGKDSLLKFIQENLQYPVITHNAKIKGRVIIRFIVNTVGNVENSEVLMSLNPFCDNEALRVINSLPRFIPGEHKGIKVPVYYTLPIRFSVP